MKQETMRCNVISQRITLQEYLTDRQEDITTQLEALVSETAPEEIKKLDRALVDGLLDQWLADFNLVQPS